MNLLFSEDNIALEKVDGNERLTFPADDFLRTDWFYSINPGSR